MRRGGAIGFVRRIKKFPEKVGVKFKDQGVNMKFLLEDLQSSVGLESRGDEDERRRSFLNSNGFRARALPGRSFGWHVQCVNPTQVIPTCKC